MGTLTAVGLLPHLLFSLPAGVWLDRVRTRRRLMIAADLGRAALIAQHPGRLRDGRAGDAAALRRRVPGRVAVGRLRPVVEHAVRVGDRSASATSRRCRCSTAAARSPRSAARRSAACSSRSSARRWRCSADALSFLGSVFFLRRIRSPEPPIEPEEGSTRERLAGRPVVRPPRPDHAPDAAVGRDHQPVHLRLERPVHPVRDDRRSASRRAPSVWRSGSARSGPDRGARRVADRPADRARTGLRARLLIFPASLLLIPLAGPGHVDAGHPGPALRLGVRGRPRA